MIKKIKKILKWCWATLPRRVVSSILIIIFIIAPISFLIKPRNVEAAWWNDSWQYRKSISVGSAGSNQTDFQVKVLTNSDLSTDITNGKIQADLDDLRFTDVNGQILPYWIEDSASTSVDVWVKIPTLTTGGATVYMYYGNVQATAYSDGENVFEFFDDFNDSSINPNKWTMANNGSGGSSTETGGNLELTSTNSQTGSATAKSVSTFTNNVVIEWKRYDTQENYNDLSFGYGNVVNTDNGGQEGSWWHTAMQYGYADIIQNNSNFQYMRMNGGGTALQSNIDGPNAGQWIKYKNIYSSAGLWNWYYDTGAGYTLIGTGQTDSTYLSDSKYILLSRGGYDGGSYGGTSKYDYIFVRKYASSIPTATAGTEEIGTGPAGYWAFDEGYGTTAHDESPNRNNGNITDGSWKSESECVSGKCLGFNGASSQIVVSDNSALDITNTLTISAWVKPTTLSPSSDMTIVRKYYNGSDNFGFFVGGGQDAAQGNLGFVYYSVSWRVIDSEYKLPDTDWHFVSVVFNYSNSSLDFYDNGILKKTKTISNNLIVNNESLTIGSQGGSKFFNGRIDEVKIYPYARTAAQIKMDYNTGVQGTNEGVSTSLGGQSAKWMTNGLVGHWKMDEASSTVVADASGNGNTGTLTNAQETGTGEAAGTTANMVDADNASLSATDDAYNNMLLYISGGGGCGISTGTQRTISDYTGSSKTIVVSPVFSAETDNCTFEIRHQSGGKFGNGVGFDGSNDYVNAGHPSSLANVNNLTYSAWINPSKTPSLAGQIFNKRYKGLYYYTDNRIHFWISTSVTNMDLVCSPTISLNTWTHVAATWDGTIGPNTNAKIYINGTECDFAGYNAWGEGTTYSEASLDLSIGSWFDGTGDFFPGKIDDARIYNRVLSPSEIQKLYNYAPGPVGHWKMDEKVSGDSKTIYDSSGNGNDGTTVDGANNTGMDCTKPGKIGSGCQLDGVDDYTSVSDPANGSLDFAFNDFTIGTWVYIPASDSNLHIIAGKWNYSDVNYGYSLVVYNGSYGIQLGSNPTKISWYDFNYSAPIITGVWQYVSATIDRDGLVRMYVNGIQTGTKDVSSYSGVDLSNSYSLIAGSRNGSGYYFSGTIDDVRIYNYARTQEQIIEDMSASAPQGLAEPLAYYKFDEGYGSTAHNYGIGTSIDGTLNSGGSGGNSTVSAMWDKGGKYGGAMEFDGTNDYVSIPDDSFLNLDQGTISVWFKTDDVSALRTVFDINKNSANTDHFEVGINGDLINSKIWVYRKHAGSWSTPAYQVYGSTTIQTNTWYHLVLERDSGGNLVMYLNGTMETLTGYLGRLTQGDTKWMDVPSAQKISIGREFYNGSDSNYFDGLIDEVKIYNYALSPDDIKTDFNNGMAMQMGAAPSANNNGTTVTGASTEYCIPGDTAQCDKPVGEWTFNEKVSGDAKTLYDTSGNGNDGTTHYGANTTGMDCTKPGKYGSGCQFDGVDDYVLSPTTTFIANRNTPHSMFAWVYLKQYPASAQDIFTFGEFNNVQYMTGLVVSSSGKLCAAHNGADCWEDSGLQIPLSKWTFVGYTRDANNFYFYLNNYSVTVANANVNQIGATDKFAIGAGGLNGIAVGFLNGYVDQARAYNYVRTPAQVAWEYNRGKPIAEYRFNECQGTTVYDESGNGNNGTINLGASGNTTPGTCTSPTDGTGAWYDGRNGKYGASLDFDGGSDYVSIADSAGLHLTNFSLSLWFKTDSWTTSSYPRLISKRNSDATMDWELYYDTASSYIKMVLGENSASASFNALNPSTGVWHHLMVTKNGTTLTLYSDGNYVESATNTATWTDSDNIYIGSREGTSRYFDGQTDDVKIFNYALTAEQVEQVYNNSSAVQFGN